MKQEQTSLEDWKTSKCGCGLCIYCCIRKEVNKSLADQKAKILNRVCDKIIEEITQNSINKPIALDETTKIVLRAEERTYDHCARIVYIVKKEFRELK